MKIMNNKELQELLKQWPDSWDVWIELPKKHQHVLPIKDVDADSDCGDITIFLDEKYAD